MRNLKILLLAAAMLLLAACGTTTKAPESSPSASPVQEGAATPSNAPDTDADISPDTGADPDKIQDTALLDCYREVLEQLYEKQLYPDGSKFEYDGFGKLSDNHFAIADIDGDSELELILSLTTAPMAGMTETVYNYDAAKNTVVMEFTAFPSVTYYDNGLIKADWSHNQGKAGDNFWPYDLYQYDADADTYTLLATVDAWDSAYEAEQFPSAVDTDSAGIVFYVMPGGYDETAAPISQTDYETWYAETFGDASALTVPYQQLTPGNIAAATQH